MGDKTNDTANDKKMDTMQKVEDILIESGLDYELIYNPLYERYTISFNRENK